VLHDAVLLGLAFKFIGISSNMQERLCRIARIALANFIYKKHNSNNE